MKAKRPRKGDRGSGIKRERRSRLSGKEREKGREMEGEREAERGRVGTLRKSGGAKPPFARARQQAGSPFRKAPPKPG